MSNSDSALVRSRLGRGSAIAAASYFTPQVVDALVRTLNTVARYATQGGGSSNSPPRNNSPQNNRAPRNRRRPQRNRGNESIPRVVINGYPDLRKTFSVFLPLNASATAGASNSWVFAVSRVNNTGLTNSSAVLAPTTVGQNASNLIGSYTYMKFHRIDIRLVPAIAATNKATIAVAWDRGGVIQQITAIEDLTQYSQFFVSGGQPANMIVTPTTMHEAKIPTSSADSNDYSESTVGGICFYTTSTQTGNIGYLQVTMDVTLLGG